MGKSKAPSVKQLPTMSPEQQQLFKDLLGNMSERFQQGGFDITEQKPFQSGQEALMGLLGGFNPQRTTEAFQQQVANPAIQQFQQEIAPAIQERGTSAGFRQSGDVQRDLSRAGTQLQSNLAGELSGRLAQGEQQGAAQQLAALQSALGYAQAPQSSQLAEYGPILQALGINPYTMYEQQGKASPFSGILGAAGGIFGGGLAAGGLSQLSGLGFQSGVKNYF